MQFIAGKFQIYQLIRNGSLILFTGLLIGLIGTSSILWISFGLFVYTFGLGIVNGLLNPPRHDA